MKLPETRYVRSGDVHIAYQVAGNGPIDLVFVPGFVSHLEYQWELPAGARLLERLASFTRLILFDKRGTGLSDRVLEVPTLEQRMDDVRVVMDAVGSGAEAIKDAVATIGLEVRLGLHTGEVEVMGEKVGGIAVHIDARVASQAKPGEILVSHTVKDLVAGSGLCFSDRGIHALKGVDGDWRLHALESVTAA